MDAVNFHKPRDLGRIDFVCDFKGSTYWISFEQYAIIIGTTFV